MCDLASIVGMNCSQHEKLSTRVMELCSKAQEFSALWYLVILPCGTTRYCLSNKIKMYKVFIHVHYIPNNINMNFATCSLYIYISVVTCMYMYFKKNGFKVQRIGPYDWSKTNHQMSNMCQFYDLKYFIFFGSIIFRTKIITV